MPRMYARTMLFAAALLASAPLSLLCTTSAAAQEAMVENAACPPGEVCPPGAGGAWGSRLSAMHGNDIQNCRPRTYGQPDLFYNYYVPPAGGSTVGVQLYPSPRPTPPLVGHTYVTYQPLMPHEFMYHHHRTYHRTYDDGRGLTRSSVHWYCPPGKNCAQHTYHIFRLAR